jgi:hypothetical protein
MRIAIAKLFWGIHDWMDNNRDWFNRVGCYIAYGKNWREKPSTI